MNPKPLTKAQATKKILAENKSELKHFMGKETLYQFKNVEDSISHLLKKSKFKKGRITFDRYGNKTIHMVKIE